MLALRADTRAGFTCAFGIGGIGAGIMYVLDSEHELGRNESRLGTLLDARDYCKLHIVQHYVSRLMGAGRARSSFRVWPIGVVGNDAAGSRLLGEMDAAGMDIRFVRTHPALKTLFSVCYVYPDGSGGNITSSNSAAQALNMDDLQAAAPLMKAAGARGVAICLPEIPMTVRLDFLRLATDCGNYRVCSFALGDIAEAQRMGLIVLADLLALNQEEASALFGNRPGLVLDEESLVMLAAQFTADHPQTRMVISVGQRGAYGFESGSSQFCPAPVLQPTSTAGAGDALLAGIVCGMAAGIPFLEPNPNSGTFSGRVLRTSLDIGVLNASFSVTSSDAIHPEAELESLFTFAALRGAFIAESLRRVCYELEPMSFGNLSPVP
jgi:sugar/nucleoside kinase (ribokinase family)